MHFRSIRGSVLCDNVVVCLDIDARGIWEIFSGFLLVQGRYILREYFANTFMMERIYNMLGSRCMYDGIIYD